MQHTQQSTQYSRRQSTCQQTKNKNKITALIIILIPLIAVSYFSRKVFEIRQEQNLREKNCYNTCRLRIVESIPDNVTFPNAVLPPTTYYAWSRLIEAAQEKLHIAAYKSSLQGKHVLGDLHEQFSREGDSVYDSLMDAGIHGSVKIKMVENYPPKDKGDNADGVILQNYGAVKRRSLDIEKVLGRGKMHSKFLLADKKHFYLGSANLDWRSLNQKMELGVLVEDCPCLGEDLHRIFKVYWNLPVSEQKIADSKAAYNMNKPLKIQIEGETSEIYLATSPKELNNKQRTWDLDAIIHEINSSKHFLDIHVMDYFPLFIYRKPRTHFPQIDDALRRAILRGVRVRLLAAALHYPEIGTRFLKSLESLNNINPNATIQVKIFKVPTSENINNIVINRERRTHNKFMVSESAVIVGTSNWSGDYFIGGTTGAAIVIRQTEKKRALIKQMKTIFQRDWDSIYAHPLDEYFSQCVASHTADFCEGEKDPSLFASPQMAD